MVSWLVSHTHTHTHTHTPSLQGNSLCSHFMSFPLLLTNPLPSYILQHVSPLELYLCFSLLPLQPSPQERQDFVSFTACFVGLSRRGEAFLHLNIYLAAPRGLSCTMVDVLRTPFWHLGSSSLTRNQTQASALGARSHWTTREAPIHCFFFFFGLAA